jgi:hypothetical protein
LRWAASLNAPNLEAKLKRYLATLAKDAKRRKANFQSSLDENEDGALHYRWTAENQARGAIFHRPECGRVFFLEINGGRKESLLPLLRTCLEGFSSNGASEPELWSLFGIGVRLPRSLKLKHSNLTTGRIQLHWTGPRVVISAGRSAFGNQLLGDGSLADWATKLAPTGELKEDTHGVRVDSKRRAALSRVHSTTLARLDPATNQLHYINAMYRDPIWRPEWDWFVSPTSSV